MTFLDSSIIVDMLEGVPEVVEAVEERDQPYLTSSLCVLEIVGGRVGSGETNVVEVRQQFGGLQALDLSEQIALEAARMQDRLTDEKKRMAARDSLVAATARSTGDELVVSDNDFETGLLTGTMDVANLRRDD
ncbi:MAG: PIN domain-containing protein [Natronomonas sp.]